MKILLTTGIYPPAIGGPAQYAKNLATAFTELGHQVTVKTYQLENKLPTGLRHLYFFFKILPSVWSADFILTLDNFSVGFPTVLAGRLLRRKVIIRTGGDFLWEWYVERTGDLVLLRNFYQTTKPRWSLKERVIFKLNKWTLHHCYRLVFSTDWQRQIWREPYRLDLSKTTIVENYYGPKAKEEIVGQKIFVSGSRELKWKNKVKLRQAFTRAQATRPGLMLDDNNVPYSDFVRKIASSYAVILTSLGDISPNFILDAIRYNKPFILTRETGLADRLQDIAVWVNPEDETNISTKILWLSDES